jgi:hypothetical protein
MQRMRVRLRSGSRAETEWALRHARTEPAWEREWREAGGAERLEAERELARRTRQAVFRLVPAAVIAALLPAIFPLTPGFSEADTLAAVVAAAVTAAVAVAIVPITTFVGRGLAGAGARDALIFTVALLSAGAAAIHFAVAKPHFDEYKLFGVFFVGSGIAQLVWLIWLLLRRWRPLLGLGALGNGLIVALWAVVRIWGLPLGPEHWKPEPVGFGDAVTAAFELLIVASCLTLLTRERTRPLRVSVAAVLTLAVAVLTALSLLSVLGVGSSFLTPTE